MRQARDGYLLYTPALRASHLERMVAEPLPGLNFAIIATGTHPDCDPLLLADPPFPVTVTDLPGAVAAVHRRPPALLEVTEPLWRAEWPASRALIEAAGAGTLAATYAIDALAPAVAPPEPVGLAAVAFGSAASAAAYRRAYAGVSWATTTVEERRGRCPCLPAGPTVPAGREVAFVAEFSARKGIDLLLAAWPGVAGANPGWRLRLLGYGPRVEAVRAWARDRPEVDVVVAAGRAAVHATLRRAAVVVLPSRRTEGWREQVGLSLVEGLAHGCRVVTTTETGIAPGLVAAGHEVVAPEDVAALATGLIRAMAAGPTKAPPEARDSRASVQAWLAQRLG